jgi:hypothetical protein
MENIPYHTVTAKKKGPRRLGTVPPAMARDF